jgi:hypothetical protein
MLPLIGWVVLAEASGFIMVYAFMAAFGVI